MIAFSSPEGQQLRGLHPPPSAIAALWLVALGEENDEWAAWARTRLADAPETGEILALRFIQAVSDTDQARARQLWAALGSGAVDGMHSHIVTAAREMGRDIGF
jgi:hypothetical protein